MRSLLESWLAAGNFPARRSGINAGSPTPDPLPAGISLASGVMACVLPSLCSTGPLAHASRYRCSYSRQRDSSCMATRRAVAVLLCAPLRHRWQTRRGVPCSCECWLPEPETSRPLESFPYRLSRIQSCPFHDRTQRRQSSPVSCRCSRKTLHTNMVHIVRKTVVAQHSVVSHESYSSRAELADHQL